MHNNAKKSTHPYIDIGNGKWISFKFLHIPVGSYDVILSMPFMIKTDATLRQGNGTATFGNSQTIIKCKSTDLIIMATLINMIDSHRDPLTFSDDEDYYDLFPQNKDSERLQHIYLIRCMTTLAIKML